MAIFKIVNVQFADSSKNYQTRVNIGSTTKQIYDYFINRVFNFGGMKYDHDTETEMETTDNHECLNVEIEQPFCRVIDGSFKGVSGYITGKMTEGCYFIKCEQTTNKCLVTTSQLQQIFI